MNSRPANTATIPWPDGVSPDDIVPVERATWEIPTAPAPSERMRDLDFLLGDFRGEYFDFTSQAPTSGVSSWQTRATHSGHIYELTLSVPVPKLNSRWIFGWHEPDACFYEIYHDDWGNHGRATSPGWQQGRLKFTGEFHMGGFQPGLVLVTQDEYTVVDENHFAKHEVIQTGEDSWVLADIVNCYRI
jgi:hypothetical protein